MSGLIIFAHKIFAPLDKDAQAAQLVTMAFDTDIAIVGGGLNGSCLALALASSGFDVTLLEANTRSSTNDDFDGRAYSLALTSQRMLVALGLWQVLSNEAQPIFDILVSDGRAGEGAGPYFMHFDHAEIEEGPMGYMVEDRHLRKVLSSKLIEFGVDHRTGETVEDLSVEPGRASVRTRSGKVSAKLVVACDGSSSPIAERAGISRTIKSYHQSALVTAVEHQLPHDGQAHQFFMPGGPLAILPLKGNRSSIVWTESTNAANEIAALDDDRFLSELSTRFGDFRGTLALAGARGCFPLGLSLANAFISDRLALVGDAAHGIHPIAGQGLNAGFKDTAALAEVLSDARKRGEDIGSKQVLERFQRWRRFDVATLTLATDFFNELFSNDSPGLRSIRGLGLGIVQSIPSVKRGLIREAAGLTGEIPKLMKGLLP